MKEVMPIEIIERKIYLLRGHKVMLDSDLAELYGVETRTLIQGVKRNIRRFPSDFMFQLTFQDVAALRSQIVTLKTGRGGHRKYAPYVFTENGVAMLSSVLNSEQAIKINIAITLTRLRDALLPKLMSGEMRVGVTRTPSIAEDEMTLCISAASYCLGFFRNGFVSFKDFFFMTNYTTARL